jgi:hypothetical protein
MQTCQLGQAFLGKSFFQADFPQSHPEPDKDVRQSLLLEVTPRISILLDATVGDAYYTSTDFTLPLRIVISPECLLFKEPRHGKRRKSHGRQQAARVKACRQAQHEAG